MAVPVKYKVKEWYLSPAQAALKYPFTMKVEYLVYHNTGNTAPAVKEATFMHNNNLQVSYHEVVDEKDLYILIPHNRNGWHAGDGNGPGNRKGLGLEIARSMDGGYSGAASARYKQAEENGAVRLAFLAVRYNIPMSKIQPHWFFSGKDCPHKMRALNREQAFRRKIQSYINQIKSQSDQTATVPAPSKAPVNKKATAIPSPFNKYNADKTPNSIRVKKGETLWSIANKYGLTVEYLKQRNGLKSDELEANQFLYIDYDRKENRGRSAKSAYVEGIIDALGAKVMKRTGSQKSGFKFTTAAGYSLKDGETVFIFETLDGWGRIYTGSTTGKGSNEWIWLGRMIPVRVFKD